MMSYWVLFIGIAVASWLVQMNLQNKFKKYSKIPTGCYIRWCERIR